MGANSDLDAVIRRTGATTLIVAIEAPDSARLLNLDRRSNALTESLSVIATRSEIMGGANKLGDISHVSAEDLIGLRPVKTDEPSISEMLA